MGVRWQKIKLWYGHFHTATTLTFPSMQHAPQIVLSRGIAALTGMGEQPQDTLTIEHDARRSMVDYTELPALETDWKTVGVLEDLDPHCKVCLMVSDTRYVFVHDWNPECNLDEMSADDIMLQIIQEGGWHKLLERATAGWPIPPDDYREP